MFRFLYACCIVFFLYVESAAQEQLGLHTENFAGTNSILLNPAAGLTNPFPWDIQLIGGAQFIENNFGHFRNASVFEVLRDGQNSFLATDFPSEEAIPRDALIFDFAQPGQKKFGVSSTRVLGPSFLLNFEKHSVGLFTGARAMGAGHQLPAIFGYYDYEAIDVNSDFVVPPSSVAGMAWSEFGLHYLYKTNNHSGSFGIGVNLKYLQGYESFFIKNHQNLQLTREIADLVTFNNPLDIDFGFTTSSLNEEAVNLENNGQGFGLDIGVQYASDYYGEGGGFRVGLSLVDIGRIQFDQRTELHNIDIKEVLTLDPNPFAEVDNYQEALDELNRQLYTDTTTTLSGSSYAIGLPTALSLQADVNVADNVYVNGTLVQRLKMGEYQVERGNLLSVTPRYEQRWFSAFLPISFYNYQQLNVGLAFRLAFLSIGTDNIGSFFGKKELTGTDFYVSLRVNPFNLERSGRRGGKKVECYEF